MTSSHPDSKGCIILLVLLIICTFVLAVILNSGGVISIEIAVIIVETAVILFGSIIEYARLKGKNKPPVEHSYIPTNPMHHLNPLPTNVPAILPSHYSSTTMPSNYEVENINRIKINR